VYTSINRSIDVYIEREGIDAPKDADYVPVWAPTEEVRRLELAGANIVAVVWCIGFRTDFAWVDLPIFDAKGHPAHERGITDVAGAYFIGLPWLYTWGSGRFSGVARDARFIALRIQELEIRKRESEAVELRAMGS
jgi:putative flavoprotein involved in K+ transport